MCGNIMLLGFLQANSLQMSLIFTSKSLCIYISAKPHNLSWHLVDRRYVFRSFRILILSHSQLVTGKQPQILVLSLCWDRIVHHTPLTLSQLFPVLRFDPSIFGTTDVQSLIGP